jgi:molybdopterin molybdotransferase
MQAEGLHLARPLTADRDYPPFDKSQMDGYAVRAADVLCAPADLRMVGEIAAGQWPQRTVNPGEAIAIMTGAPMPPGAEGVVPVEDCQKLSSETVRILSTGGDPARFVARRGGECVAGQVVLTEGTQMGPAQIAVAASVGASEVEVFAAPRVAVLATGDELVPGDQQPGPAQIRNSNTPMLLSLLRRLGCEVVDLGTVPDQLDATREALVRGLTHDVLFVTGGMSMGEYDYVPRLLQEIGVDLKITKLRIKPGKPFVFGVFVPASSYVFGLPGNPVSGYVCTVRLASRLLARLSAGAVEERWLTGMLDTALPSNGPREFYQPAIWKDANGAESATVTPLKWKGSADLFTLAQANCLLVRRENESALPQGTLVRVLELL